MKLRFLGLFAALFFFHGCNFGTGPTGGGTGADGLTGILVDGGGKVVANAKVRVYPDSSTILAKAARTFAARKDSTVTNAQGRYNFVGLPAGRYNLTATYVRQDTTYALFLGGIVYDGGTLDLGADTARAASELWVHVTDAQDLPVSGAICDVPGTQWRDVSDSNGFCVIPGVAAGDLLVRVRAPGKEPVTSPVTVAAGEITPACQVTLVQSPPPTPFVLLSAIEINKPSVKATFLLLPGGGSYSLIDYYRLEIAVDSLFAFPVLIDSISRDLQVWIVTVQPDVRYYGRLIAVGPGGSTSSGTFNFISVTSAPSAPDLLLPAVNATGVSANAALTWMIPEVDVVDYYRVQVSTDSLFTTFFSNDSLQYPFVAGASYQLFTGTLAPLTRYYWRVVAVGPGGTAISRTLAFTTRVATKASTPPAAQLYQPAQGDTAVSTSLMLTWAVPADGPTTQFKAQVSTDSLFGTFAAQDTGWTQPFILQGAYFRTFGPLNARTRYYWRVLATTPGDIRSDAAISETRTFKTQ